MITIDCADPQKLAAWWAEALGVEDTQDYDAFVVLAATPLVLGFQRVPEPRPGKNRVHIDVRVAGEPPWDMADRERLIRTKVAQLVGGGATVVREEAYGPHLGHVVMLDPEGNEFCVA